MEFERTMANFGIGSSIRRLIPRLEGEGHVAHEYDFLEFYLQFLLEHRYQERHDSGRLVETRVERFDPIVGQRFLSWSSNVPEGHIMLDLHSFQFVEIPIFFPDIDEDTILLSRLDAEWVQHGDGFIMTDLEVSQYNFRPNLEHIRVTHLVGLDADYFYFVHLLGIADPYILRIE